MILNLNPGSDNDFIMANAPWSEKLFDDVEHDAKITYENHYGGLGKYRVVEVGRNHVVLTVEELRELDPENIGWWRLDAATPEAAYSDAPRGERDVESVRYHMAILKGAEGCISPVVIYKKQDRYLMLDGMHRLVACGLTGSPIHAWIIKMVPV